MGNKQTVQENFNNRIYHLRVLLGKQERLKAFITWSGHSPNPTTPGQGQPKARREMFSLALLFAGKEPQYLGQDCCSKSMHHEGAAPGRGDRTGTQIEKYFNISLNIYHGWFLCVGSIYLLPFLYSNMPLFQTVLCFYYSFAVCSKMQLYAC